MEPNANNPNSDNPASRPPSDPRLLAAAGTAGLAAVLLLAAGDYMITSSRLWPIAAVVIAGAIFAVARLLWLRARRDRIPLAPAVQMKAGVPAPDPEPRSPLPPTAIPAAPPPPLADSGVPTPRRVAAATATWFDLRQTVRRALHGTDSPDANRLAYRIDARLPERVLTCEESLSALLRALTAAVRDENACCLYLDAAVAANGRVGVELEIRRKTPGTAKAPAAALAAAEALIHDLGGRLDHHPEIGTLVVDGRIELDATAADDIASPVRYPGRALFVMPDRVWEKLGTQMMLPPHGSCVAVSSFDTAAREVALSIRHGKPYSVVLASSDLVFQPQTLEAAREFGRKCAVANVPFHLLGEPRPNRDFLHDLGYAGWLAELDGPTLRRAMQAAETVTTDRSPSVVPVAPWLWGKRRERRRVLVVDDMRTTRLIVSDILKANDYDVDAVDNAETALQRLAQGNLSLAVLDLHMPGTDGITLLQRYHESGPAERVPILILTANTSKVATQECAAAGADAFLTKPIHSENLLNVVRTLIAEEDLRRYGERRIPTTASPESLPLLERDAFRGIAHFVPATEIIRQFHAETSDILTLFERALHERQFDTCTDQARSLRTCALAVGASALAGAAERLESLDVEQLEQTGASAATSLRRLLAASIEAMAYESS